ncbi:hypothetical protein LA080_008833 [Diaporthe eres]|nr:hypothetical protein LA080_008833 [Diaporthe eres]
MATPVLRPLDDALVAKLRNDIQNQGHLFTPVARAHWEAILNHFEGRSDFEIRAYIAQNFKSNHWIGNEAWFLDNYTQKVFQGYEPTEFVQSGIPALDDEARSHYNPSNTIGRGNLFPALPVVEPGPSILNQEGFDALSPAQRQRYQLTSTFGGYRFERVPQTSTTSGGGNQGVPADNTSGINVPPFNNSITNDPVDNNAGTQGTQNTTPTGTSIFGIPTPPLSNQTGTRNVQRPDQPGGTSGVPPGIVPPDLPSDVPPPPPAGISSGNQLGSNTVPPGPGPAAPVVDVPIRYPDLPMYPDLPPVPPTVPSDPPVTTGTTPFGGPPPMVPTATSNPPVTTGTTPFGVAPPVVPVAPTHPPITTGPTPPGVPPQGPPGPTPITVGTTTVTDGSTSGTAGTTPGTAGPKPPGTVPPPAGPGIAPVTPERTPGDRVPPPPGPEIPPTTTGGPPGSTGNLGVPPMTPWNTPRDTAPPPAPGGVPPGTPRQDGSVPPPLQPSPSDMQNSFIWRGQVQPPIGTRLREIIVLLDEGDVDREMHWETYVREARELLEDIESGKGPVVGPESALLVRQALEKIRAHQLFETTHYGPNTPNKIVTADMITAPEPRLKYNGKLPLILGRDHKDNEHLQPEDFPTHPRAEMVVNDQWLTEVERRAGLTEEKRSDRQAGLSRDEEEWWRLGQFQTPAQNNAALRQEQTFEQCIARDGVGFQGWIDTRLEGNGTLTRTLFHEAKLGDGKDCYARERAVRRAGLQAALRQFSSHENRVANTPWRRVRLPLSAAEVEVMRKNTGAGPSRKYDLGKLLPQHLQATDGKNDPQGFTANMAKFWADQNRDMVRAREAVVSRMGFGLPAASAPGQAGVGAPSVLPPTSLWGAYVDSGLSAEDEYHRQMLKEMRTTRKLFERELKIAPRNLLKDMKTLYDRGLKGLDSNYVPVGGQQERGPAALGPRDLVRGGAPRDLDRMEIYWIRFLLTQSITPEMTQELEPRASLFILFADKLARIFSDVSDPLFPCNNTKVSVEDLIDYIHDRTDGPVRRIRFYPHDVQMWLERLHSQGRCRYQEDWRCYGWVMRPIPTCHPEQLVRWTSPEEVWRLRPDERNEDVVLAPRFDRLRNWHSLVRRGLQNSPLDQRVEDYFLVLAYRWGVYMAKFTGDDSLEQRWKTQPPRPSGEMSRAIGDYKNEFDRITQWNNAPTNPLVRLVKATLNDKANDNNLTAEASLQLIRDNIIKEAVKKDSMLWPARSANDYLDPHDEKVRPKVWGWARPEVRGKVKRFFSVNRWPLKLQTERRQDIITRDKDVDTDLIWKPELEDPTPSKYYRPKARPYIDEKVQFRAGHRNFRIGDTPHQKQVVIDRMFAQMGRDIEPPSFIERWSNYLMSRFDEEDPDRYQEPGAKLRKFRPEDIPVSEDKRRRKRDADGDAPGQGRPKRPRRRGPGVLNDGLQDGEDDDDNDGDRVRQPHAGGVPARQPPPRVPPAEAPAQGAPGAGAENAEAAGAEEEGTWWDYASMAMAI